MIGRIIFVLALAIATVAADPNFKICYPVGSTHVDYFNPGQAKQDLSAHYARFVDGDNGDNGNSGKSEDDAWATIQHAANQLSGGEVVFIREGMYVEYITVNDNASGTLGRPTVFRNYPGEKAVVRGKAAGYIWKIKDVDNVELAGLHITGTKNYSSDDDEDVPCGVYVTGSSSNVHLHHLDIYTIQNVADSEDANAQGIAVYGTHSNANQAIKNCTIEYNNVFDLKTGQSETIAVNGNVNGFQVRYNWVHDNNNIGIDAIGGEETSDDYEADTARNGAIYGNVMSRNDNTDNPAYGGDACSDGLYADGSRTVMFANNLVFASILGVEAASEHSNRGVIDILVDSNVVWKNQECGLSAGGYDKKRGWSQNTRFINNVLWHNGEDASADYTMQELQLQYNITGLHLVNNTFVTSDKHDELIGNNYELNRKWTVEHNRFHIDNPDTPAFVWKKKEYTSIDKFNDELGTDSNSLSTNTPDSVCDISGLHCQNNAPILNCDFDYISGAWSPYMEKMTPRVAPSLIPVPEDPNSNTKSKKQAALHAQTMASMQVSADGIVTDVTAPRSPTAVAHSEADGNVKMVNKMNKTEKKLMRKINRKMNKHAEKKSKLRRGHKRRGKKLHN